MARRLLSAMTRMRGGPTLGGSPTRVYIYDDEALTSPSDVFRRATGVGEQPNPISPNAGRSTSLTDDALSADTVIDVASVAGFQVGDLVPIYDGTVTAYRVIVSINGGANQLTLDSALGADFDADLAVVGNADMRGHVWGWLEDTRDYYVQTEDVASGRVMPPLQLPVEAPTAVLEGYDEGVSVITGGAIDVRGTGIALTSDPAIPALRITHGDLGAHGGTITDSGHGARTGPADAHEYADITGLADHSALHDAGGADALAIDAAAATGSLRTLGLGAAQAAPGDTFADHNPRHEPGGADAMAVDAAAATGSLRTVGYGSLKALDGVGLTTAEAALSGDVTLSSANTYFDGPSISLAAGTWFIVGTVTTTIGGQRAHTAKLWDGSTVEASSQFSKTAAGSGADQMSITLSGIVVLGGTTTMKISVASSAGTTDVISAAAVLNGVGNNASYIRAVRVA